MLKIRCSQIGKIMTNARSKKDVLSSSTKKYLQELAIENMFGRYKEFKSKYTDKGIIKEDESIRLVEEVLQTGFIWKNEEKYKNNFLTGIPDVVADDFVIDVKTSWDIFTYPHFEETLTNKAYYYQLMGYMWLTGKTRAYLCYCLVNTPSEQVEDEIRREHWQQKLIDESQEVRDHVEIKHNFDDIHNKLKVKSYRVDFDEEVIEQIKNRIINCRVYYNDLIEKLTIKDFADVR